MKIVVLGGSGRIGSRLVKILKRDGHEVVAASRRSGVDAITRKGLAEAVSGAAVVVDALNSQSFDDAPVFFATSTENLLAVEASAGVRHHVAVSIVGAGRLPENDYFRAKRAQEALIKQSSIAYSIIQSTEFFEFLNNIADAATRGSAVRVPPVHFQPIAADDVARTVAKIATGSPLNGSVEIGGPEPFYLDVLLQRVLGARNDPRDVFADSHGQFFGSEINELSLLPGVDAVRGEMRFDDWLGRSEPAQLEENETYRVSVDGEIGRVEVPVADAQMTRMVR